MALAWEPQSATATGVASELELEKVMALPWAALSVSRWGAQREQVTARWSALAMVWGSVKLSARGSELGWDF